VDPLTMFVAIGVLAGLVIKKRKDIGRSWKSGIPKSIDKLPAYLRSQLIGLGNSLLFYGVVYLILYFGYQLVSQFLRPTIPSDVAIEMLKAIIGLDGVLIGFVGVTGIFVLSEISRTIEKAGIAYYQCEETLEGWRTSTMWLLWWAVVGFAASVLFSLQSMSYMDKCKEVSMTSFLLPMDAMLLGIAGIAWIIHSSKIPSKS